MSRPTPTRYAGLDALLAQLVEHFHGKEGVDGSSPSEGSLFGMIDRATVGAFVRAGCRGAGGVCRWFLVRAVADVLERSRKRQPAVEVDRVPALVGDVADGTGRPLLEFEAQ
jgi:hypothetical protein